MPARPPRLLLLLDQSPFDAASGAAVSMRHMACLLAEAGWTVQALSTGLTEHAGAGALPSAPMPIRTHRAGVVFEQVGHTGAALDDRFARLLGDFQPDILLTFGADAAMRRRRAAARANGIVVVFALHNLAHLRDPQGEYDHLLAPSEFLAARYRDTGLTVQTLPLPVLDAEVVADAVDPVFFTFVNPERAKGAEVVARLAIRQPHLPFLVIEARARAGHFLAIAKAAGIEAARLGNVMTSPGRALPRDIMAVSRAILMPSLVDEAAGRLAAEAQANGIPPIVSDAGGLPEIVGPGGLVIPFRRARDGMPIIDDALIAAWSDAVAALAEDAGHARAVAIAREHGRRWHSAALRPAMTSWFTSLLG